MENLADLMRRTLPEKILSYARTTLFSVGWLVLLLSLITLALAETVPSSTRNLAAGLLPVVLVATFVVVVVVAYKIAAASESPFQFQDEAGAGRATSGRDASNQRSDRLDRTAFVRSVVTRIDSVSLSEESTVFGLVGSWGSGKTTILDEVQANLEPEWKTIQFSPWSAADPAGVGLEFLRVLNAALDLRPDHERREAVARYAQYVVPAAAALPVVGTGLSATLQRYLDHASISPPWYEEYRRLSAMLLVAEKRVLVIVDDVDRLAPAELDALLRVLRLLGRFHNVHYLVAYDQGSVEELIAASGARSRAQSYMEKIVQVPFEVPPMSSASTTDLLTEAIRLLLAVSGESLDLEGDERAAELLRVLASQAKTPRVIERFKHQLEAFANHVIGAELDVLDFIAVTWLRLAHHAAWEAVPGWKTELLSGRKQVGLLETEEIKQDEWISRLASLHGVKVPRDALLVLSFLFEVVTLDGYPHYQRHSRGLGSEEYFERYFVLDLPKDDIADHLVDEGLKALAVGAETWQSRDLVEAMSSQPSPKAATAIRKGYAARSAAAQGSRSLVLMLVSIYKKQDNHSFRFGSVDSVLTDWMLRETLLAIRSSELSAEDMRSIFPGVESLRLAHRLSRNLELRPIAQRALAPFARAWLGDLSTDKFEQLLDEGVVRLIISLADWCLEPKEVDESLAGRIVDVGSFLRVAGGFFYFHEWVGGDVHWELDFDSSGFRRAVGETVFRRYASMIEPSLPPNSYAVDDLPAREVDDDVREDFIARRIKRSLDEMNGDRK